MKPFIILLVLVLIICLLNYKYKYYECFQTVPLHIWQTWHTLNMSESMTNNINELKYNNPEFEHHLYDLSMCRNFIQNNFNNDVLQAYDKLKPLSYKSDLWRYCVLYIKGGIYVDVKFKCVPGFKLIELTNNEHYVLERPYANTDANINEDLQIINTPNYYNSHYTKISDITWENKKIPILTGFIVCKAGSLIMKKCIDMIVNNTKTNYYGYNTLYPTGPGVLGKAYFDNDFSKIDSIDLFFSLTGNKILNREKVILEYYPNYHEKDNTKNRHANFWNNKDIYN